MRLVSAMIAVMLAGSLAFSQEVPQAVEAPAAPNAETAPAAGDEAAPTAPANEQLEVTAQPEVVPVQRTLTVENGSGSGSYTAGTVVKISPGMPPEGKVFDKWTGAVEAVKLPNVPDTEVVMPDNDAAISASFKDAPADAAGAFLEMNNLVVMEAENAAPTPGIEAAEGIEWTPVEPFEGAVGAVMQAGPNLDVNADESTDGPALNFRVYFQNPGEYRVFVRLPVLGARDNSVNIGFDGELIAINVYNTTGRWHWSGAKSEGFAVVTEPGVHTVNVWMREDDVVVDRVMLRTNAQPLTAVDNPAFPPESPRLPEMEAAQ